MLLKLINNSLSKNKRNTLLISIWKSEEDYSEFCQLSAGLSPIILVRLRSNFKQSLSVLPPISKYLETC